MLKLFLYGVVEVDMPPRRGKVGRSGSRETTKPTMDSEVHSVNPDAAREQKEALYDRVA